MLYSETESTQKCCANCRYLVLIWRRMKVLELRRTGARKRAKSWRGQARRRHCCPAELPTEATTSVPKLWRRRKAKEMKCADVVEAVPTQGKKRRRAQGKTRECRGQCRSLHVGTEGWEKWSKKRRIQQWSCRGLCRGEADLCRLGRTPSWATWREAKKRSVPRSVPRGTTSVPRQFLGSHKDATALG